MPSSGYCLVLLQVGRFFLFDSDIPAIPQIQLKQESNLQTLLEEKLHSLVKPEESMWSLHKGECLQVGAGECAVLSCYHVICTA